jgi:CHAT domain-containing protein
MDTNSLNEPLNLANLAFQNKNWDEANIHFKEAIDASEQLFYKYPNSLNELITKEGSLFDDYAYSLASSNKYEYAIEIIEKGKARFWTNLILHRSKKIKDKEEDEDNEEGDYRNFIRAVNKVEQANSRRSQSAETIMSQNITHESMRRLAHMFEDETFSKYQAIKNHKIKSNERLNIQFHHVYKLYLTNKDFKASHYYHQEDFLEMLATVTYFDHLSKQHLETLDWYKESLIRQQKELTLPEEELAKAQFEYAKAAKKIDKKWFNPSITEFASLVGEYSAILKDTAFNYVVTTCHGTQLLLLRVAEDGQNHIYHREVTDLTLSTLENIVKPFISLQSQAHGLNNNGEEFNKSIKTLIKRFDILLSRPINRLMELLKMKRLVVIPSGKLNHFPFYAGMINTTKYESSYQPSFRLFQISVRNLTDKDMFMLFVKDPQPTSFSELHFSMLEYSLSQHKFIFPWGEKAFFVPRILEKETVNKFHLDSYLTGETSEVVHFSCHATFDWNEPFNSGILISDDNVYSLADLFNINTKSRLAILSCCQTGMTDTNLPNESIGLPAGFLRAGYSGVISTLWAVNDLSTSLITARFYDYFIDDNNRPQRHSWSALAMAQHWVANATVLDIILYLKSKKKLYKKKGTKPELRLECLKEIDKAINIFKKIFWLRKPFRHPFFWAGFIYSGI